MSICLDSESYENMQACIDDLNRVFSKIARKSYFGH